MPSLALFFAAGVCNGILVWIKQRVKEEDAAKAGKPPPSSVGPEILKSFIAPSVSVAENVAFAKSCVKRW